MLSQFTYNRLRSFFLHASPTTPHASLNLGWKMQYSTTIKRPKIRRKKGVGGQSKLLMNEDRYAHPLSKNCLHINLYIVTSSCIEYSMLIQYNKTDIFATTEQAIRQ